MMKWLRRNWRWLVLNLFGLSLMAILLGESRVPERAQPLLDPMLDSGKWAIRFLLICLAMSPLNTYLGWRSAIKLRKPAGLWAFAFAVLHLAVYLSHRQLTVEWQWEATRSYIVLGISALGILTLLAITSNKWAMRHLRKNWKRLHRLVYIAGCLTVLHAMTAAAMSKKVFVQDPQAQYELKLYLAVVVVLLTLRVPLVRRLGQRAPRVLARVLPRRQGRLAVGYAAIPDDLEVAAIGIEPEPEAEFLYEDSPYEIATPQEEDEEIPIPV